MSSKICRTVVSFALLMTFIPVILTRPSEEEDQKCHQQLESQRDYCRLQLQTDLTSRMSDAPPQFDCCIVARFESCMQNRIPTSCFHDVTKSIKSVLKDVKVTMGCEKINYPSIYCYAYFFRDLVGIVIITMLVTFTCYVTMVCCRSFFSRVTRGNPRVVIAMRPVTQMEKRPLILVSEHC
jgi:hypothetical protein